MAIQYTSPAKQLLRKWLDWNPTGWQLYNLDDIAEHTGVSRSSVYG